jgi:multidrug efflux system membrane fusion protein
VETDQGQKVLFVVNDQDVAEKRRVQLGKAFDGLREVVAGLKAGERVVVDGLQRVQPGAVVAPQPVDMPAGTEAAAALTRN